jgi:toxin ParE1/3/4
MARLVFSIEASADIDDITAFSLERFGSDVTDAYLTGLEIRFQQLRDYPKLGARYPRLHTEIRCLTYRSHRIFYQATEDTVLVVRVLHHGQDVRAELN